MKTTPDYEGQPPLLSTGPQVVRRPVLPVVTLGLLGGAVMLTGAALAKRSVTTGLFAAASGMLGVALLPEAGKLSREYLDRQKLIEDGYAASMADQMVDNTRRNLTSTAPPSATPATPSRRRRRTRE